MKETLFGVAWVVAFIVGWAAVLFGTWRAAIVGALVIIMLLFTACATPPQVHKCKLYQPPRGYCAYTDRE